MNPVKKRGSQRGRLDRDDLKANTIIVLISVVALVVLYGIKSFVVWLGSDALDDDTIVGGVMMAILTAVGDLCQRLIRNGR